MSSPISDFSIGSSQPWQIERQSSLQLSDGSVRNVNIKIDLNNEKGLGLLKKALKPFTKGTISEDDAILHFYQFSDGIAFRNVAIRYIPAQEPLSSNKITATLKFKGYVIKITDRGDNIDKIKDNILKINGLLKGKNVEDLENMEIEGASISHEDPKINALLSELTEATPARKLQINKEILSRHEELLALHKQLYDQARTAYEIELKKVRIPEDAIGALARLEYQKEKTKLPHERDDFIINLDKLKNDMKFHQEKINEEEKAITRYQHQVILGKERILRDRG
jgi:hypothetical protein